MALINALIIIIKLTCLKVDLLFKREFSYYLIQIYIPCCMLVIVSWVSFWLDQGAVPARVSLGVTTLLTMATQTSGINASLPPVSYTKAIDVWTGVCLTFVFGALLEFALVNYASRSDMHSDAMKKKIKQQQMDLEAIDVWTGVCLTFVFGALLEFALVNYASRSDTHRENMKKQRRQQQQQFEFEAHSLEVAKRIPS
ncbi:hypothetical protein B566_EDAN009690 [Ephemera danica]|nr:hypothetical protein B566_EDAN009690 [Ephemera danica]